ncbi:NADAR family protein [Chromobacterium sp. ASV23]|uniref:NADAR family protein n=1 Tax=Chromobacterium sp. ASV23 TaxID=2795110 RepID=UPI0021054E35|nr:NADAR family protein [Chromobacterium sp. ASV23]
MSNIRKYPVEGVASFYRTDELYGDFSNMARQFPLLVNGKRIGSSEALYQSLKYPSRPDIQRFIIHAGSPIESKRVCAPFGSDVREDWLDIRVYVMKMVVSIKYLQYQKHFSRIFEISGDMPIVEISSFDQFWGAQKRGEYLVGENVLGRIWMGVREFYWNNGLVNQREFKVREGINLFFIEESMPLVSW